MPTDERLAALVLPTLDDLWGAGWRRHVDGQSNGAPALGDNCLPGDFPDDAITADDAVTFERPPAVVHATAVLFADQPRAVTAWHGLTREEFTRCFAAELTADITAVAGATGEPRVELLGPVVPATDFGVERERRIATHRVVYSAAADDAVLPLAIETAVIVTGRAVVVVWAFDPDRGAADEGWPRLVERVVRRCEAARVSG